MEYSSESLLSFQTDQILDLLHKMFFNLSVVFLSNGFENDLAKVLEGPPKRIVFRPLLDNVEKGIPLHSLDSTRVVELFYVFRIVQCHY